jgi:hypothetical protein
MKCLPALSFCACCIIAALLELSMNPPLTGLTPLDEAAKPFLQANCDHDVASNSLAEEEELAELVDLIPGWVLVLLPESELTAAIKDFKQALEERDRYEQTLKAQTLHSVSPSVISLSTPRVAG